MPDNLRRLTQTEYHTHRRCEERHRLRYEEGLVGPRRSAALSIGSAFHTGLENLSPQLARQAILEPEGGHSDAVDMQTLEIQAEVAYIMVDVAIHHWGFDFFPEHREIAFEIPLVNPHTGKASTVHSFAGVMDGFSREGQRSPGNPFDQMLAGDTEKNNYGGSWIVPTVYEWKTTGQDPTSTKFTEKWLIDGQISLMMDGASAKFNTRVLNAIVGVVRKPTIRLRKNESVAEYLDRVREQYQERADTMLRLIHITRTGEQLQRHRYELWEFHKRLLALRRLDAFPLRNTNACLDFGGCPYFNLCTGHVGPEAFQVLSDVHPELPRKESP